MDTQITHCIRGEKHNFSIKKTGAICLKCGVRPDRELTYNFHEVAGFLSNTIVLDGRTLRQSPNQRKAATLRAQHGDVCAYCGIRLHDGIRTLDHYVPTNHGGSNAIGNMRLACKQCNKLKGDIDGPVWDLLRTLGVCSSCIKMYKNLEFVPKCCASKWERRLQHS